MQFWISVSLALCLTTTSFALNNGLSKTPAMGWNPYNAFLFVLFHLWFRLTLKSLPHRCATTEAQYHASANSLVSLGLSALGYQYFNLYARNAAPRTSILT